MHFNFVSKSQHKTKKSNFVSDFSCFSHFHFDCLLVYSEEKSIMCDSHRSYPGSLRRFGAFSLKNSTFCSDWLPELQARGDSRDDRVRRSDAHRDYNNTRSPN